MNPLENFLIPLGTTPEDRCPYLDDRSASLLFYQPILPGGADFDAVLARGFRRHGGLFYRPSCPLGCRECIPIRVPVKDFRLSRSQRRLLRRSSHLYEVRESDPVIRRSLVDLFNKHARHVSPDARPLGIEDYVEFLLQSPVRTRQFEYRVAGRIVGVAILDVGVAAASSIYFYWDPDVAELGPGTFSVLREIEWCANRGIDHYYLGYSVRGCGSMDYKERFRPHEVMDWSTGKWRRSVSGAN